MPGSIGQFLSHGIAVFATPICIGSYGSFGKGTPLQLTTRACGACAPISVVVSVNDVAPRQIRLMFLPVIAAGPLVRQAHSKVDKRIAATECNGV